MSTNKTQNYNLHSWEPEDDFRLHEINENFTTLDTQLHGEVTALQTLLQAQGVELDKKIEVSTGSYIGTAQPTYLELGCVPKAVIIMRSSQESGYVTSRYYALLVPGFTNPAATFEGTGMTITMTDGQVLTAKDAYYNYMVIR